MTSRQRAVKAWVASLCPYFSDDQYGLGVVLRLVLRNQGPTHAAPNSYFINLLCAGLALHGISTPGYLPDLAATPFGRGLVCQLLFVYAMEVGRDQTFIKHFLDLEAEYRIPLAQVLQFWKGLKQRSKLLDMVVELQSKLDQAVSHMERTESGRRDSPVQAVQDDRLTQQLKSLEIAFLHSQEQVAKLTQELGLREQNSIIRPMLTMRKAVEVQIEGRDRERQLSLTPVSTLKVAGLEVLFELSGGDSGNSRSSETGRRVVSKEAEERLAQRLGQMRRGHRRLIELLSQE